MDQAPRRRVAFVVGNSAYVHNAGANTLPCCVNDARDMSACLTSLGFTAPYHTNMTRTQMVGAWERFVQTLQPRDVVVVYFSGHGTEEAGTNYLLPLDAVSPVDDGLSFSTMLRQLNRVDHTLNIIMLDCCRENPGESTWKCTTSSSGLAHPDVRFRDGTAEFLIAYACEPGTVAITSATRLSPFTASILQRMTQPHHNLQQLFMRVRIDVLHSTQRIQKPAEYCTLVSTFSFLEPCTASEEPLAVPVCCGSAPAPAPSSCPENSSSVPDVILNAAGVPIAMEESATVVDLSDAAPDSELAELLVSVSLGAFVKAFARKRLDLQSVKRLTEAELGQLELLPADLSQTLWQALHPSASADCLSKRKQAEGALAVEEDCSAPAQKKLRSE